MSLSQALADAVLAGDHERAKTIARAMRSLTAPLLAVKESAGSQLLHWEYRDLGPRRSRLRPELGGVGADLHDRLMGRATVLGVDHHFWSGRGRAHIDPG
ncbi:MAG TPA: hypothetical protein VHN14_33600 [Kofleriaceae bacterium]|nr:hypothetical protein [Kofleriaceae bacterium]